MAGRTFQRVLITLALTSFSAVAAGETNLTISVDGAAALVLRIPQAANVTVTGDHTVVQTTDTTFHLWPIASAKIPDEALPRVADLIKGEFINFKPKSTNDLLIAGAPARHVSGTGNEADDGDPGAAEVVLFVAGKHVFAACAHGEFDDAVRRTKVMMVVLKTARAP
jgi:hypothetical protein